MERTGECEINCNWCAMNNLLRLDKGTGRLRNEEVNRDRPDNSLIKIGHDIEKSPGDMRLSLKLQ